MGRALHLGSVFRADVDAGFFKIQHTVGSDTLACGLAFDLGAAAGFLETVDFMTFAAFMGEAEGDSSRGSSSAVPQTLQSDEPDVSG